VQPKEGTKLTGIRSKTTNRKLLVTLALVVGVGGLAVFGTFAAFTATTSNSGNTISSGTVNINQHSGATTLYSLTNQKPGDSLARCVRVTYTGSLAASVKLYASAGITGGSNYNLQVERGSGLTAPAADMNCTGFSASSTPYDGQLSSFASTYAGGYDGKASGTAWSTNDSVDYRFTISQNDDTTANAHTSTVTSGTHSFTWEARNN
jgi:hypothetical protein